MDVRTFIMITQGYIDRRQVKLDDGILIGTVTGLKAAQYVGGSNDASKPVRIRLREETMEEKLIATIKDLGLKPKRVKKHGNK